MFWNKKTPDVKTEAEIKTNFKERTDFKLTTQIERDLLPYMEITDKIVSRMTYLQFHDETIKEIRKAIELAEKSIREMNVSSDKPLDTLDQLIRMKQEAETKEQLLLIQDKEVRELDRLSKEKLLDTNFYSKLIQSSYVITEDEINNLEAQEVETMVAFFLTNIRAKKKSLTPFSMN